MRELIESPLSEAELSAIESRAATASPAPWGWWEIKDSSAGWQGPDLVSWCGGGELPTNRIWGLSHPDNDLGMGPQVLEFPEGAPLPSAEDATFIAHAREDVPRLAGEIRRLRTQLEAVRAAIGPA
jgi:hypothetical protein